MTAPYRQRVRSSAGCLITPSTTMLRIMRQPPRKCRPLPEHLSLRVGERPCAPHYPEEPGPSLRRPEPHAWIGISRGIGVRPLTPSLSPSDGERVPFRAGEGASAGPPGQLAAPRAHL